ncbi:MAG: lysostaphin resistance A-like protein [Pirellulales bacterium]
MTTITCFYLFVGAIVLASVSVWGRIAWKRSAGIELITYRPRHDVPWSALHLCVFILMYFSFSLGAAWVANVDPEHDLQSLDSAAKIRFVASFAVATLIGTVAGALFVMAAAGAQCRDLGLPTCIGRLRDDLWVGLLGFLAAVVPIYGLKIVLSFIQLRFGQRPVDHSLLTMLMDDPFGVGAAVVAVAAVVAAPISEEFAFRLLLQGWMEKIERRWVGGCRTTAPQPVAGPGEIPVSDPTTVGSLERGTAETFTIDGRAEGERVGSAAEWRTSHLQWRSIVLSSSLFGLMHLGTGLDPIPLFFLGAILGYLYNKTHRLLPCVVVHMLFNGFSLACVWLPIALND